MSAEIVALVLLVTVIIALFIAKPQWALQILGKLRLKGQKEPLIPPAIIQTLEIAFDEDGFDKEKLKAFLQKAVLEQYEQINAVQVDFDDLSLKITTESGKEVEIDQELVESWLNSFKKLEKRAKDGELNLELSDFE